MHSTDRNVIHDSFSKSFWPAKVVNAFLLTIEPWCRMYASVAWVIIITDNSMITNRLNFSEIWIKIKQISFTEMFSVEMAAILFRPQCVKPFHSDGSELLKKNNRHGLGRKFIFCMSDVVTITVIWSHGGSGPAPKQSIFVNISSTGQSGRHFADDIFTCFFLIEKFCIWILISLKFVPKGPIDNNPALVQIMAWRRIGDKPLSEPMLTRFTGTFMRH